MNLELQIFNKILTSEVMVMSTPKSLNPSIPKIRLVKRYTN